MPAAGFARHAIIASWKAPGQTTHALPRDVQRLLPAVRGRSAIRIPAQGQQTCQARPQRRRLERGVEIDTTQSSTPHADFQVPTSDPAHLPGGFGFGRAPDTPEAFLRLASGSSPRALDRCIAEQSGDVSLPTALSDTCLEQLAEVLRRVEWHCQSSIAGSRRARSVGRIASVDPSTRTRLAGPPSRPPCFPRLSLSSPRCYGLAASKAP